LAALSDAVEHGSPQRGIPGVFVRRSCLKIVIAGIHFACYVRRTSMRADWLAERSKHKLNDRGDAVNLSEFAGSRTMLSF
jgi:hypothetical protein